MRTATVVQAVVVRSQDQHHVNWSAHSDPINSHPPQPASEFPTELPTDSLCDLELVLDKVHLYN
jgi:hypothetical protein